jgi:hypothetical protein
MTLPWGHAHAVEGTISRFDRAVCDYFTLEERPCPRLVRLHSKTLRESGHPGWAVQLLKELPRGTEIRVGHHWPIMFHKDRFKSEQERREWIIKTINEFVNVLGPRLRRWHDETRHV